MFKKTILLTLVCMFVPVALLAQGITTAALNGSVKDQKGGPLIGANVAAVHEPSGTTLGAASRTDGRFNIPGVRVGGPYTVTASYIGYKNQKQENVYLALGQDLKIDFVLPEEAVELGEIVTVAERDKIFSASRTGSVTNFSTEKIQRLATLSRSISDFGRLTPTYSSAGPFANSFAGRNNLYNNVTIDGSVFNNVFGLASEVGGQTNAQPISLDAVEEIQVSLAPYDVREGSFTGANISVITKAGTNQLQGAAYYYGRNESLISDKVAGADVINTKFSQGTYGVRLSGPVIPKRAFLFANAEFGRRDDPGTTFRAALTPEELANPPTGVSRVLASDLNRLRDFVQDEFGFDPGTFDGYTLDTYNDKVTTRFDLNINPTNRLTVRYNYLKSYRDTPLSNSGASGGRQPSASRLPFSGSNYLINNNAHSIIAQLNSTFSNKYSNQFVIGYTALRDFRDAKISRPFPTVDIENGLGSTITTFGFEPFTANNKLDSDIFQVSNNFSAYYGKHTVTFGTAHEVYSFSNGFTPNFNSIYRFRTLDEFINHVNNTPSIDTNNDGTPDAVPQPTRFEITYSAVPGVAVPLAEISAWQASLYAQDEFQVTPGLRLIGGLRVDFPIYTKDLPANPTIAGLTFANGGQIDVSKLPDATPLWSPRLGFNWDVRGNRSLQVRGGTGVFTGKIPFVWLSNQASNNGVLFGSTLVTTSGAAAGVTPLFDPATQQNITFNPDRETYVPANPSLPATVLINATANDFKFPQVWRSNVAFDARLPYGFIGTVEGIYSKDINAVFHRNANFAAPVGNFAGADNRPRFAGSSSGTRINQGVTNAIILDNTSKGYQYFLTTDLKKDFANGFANLAYTYGRARDLTSSPSAIAATAWLSNQIVNSPNDPSLGFNVNDQRHRIVGTASYRLNLLGLAGTTFSIIYIGGTGSNYSYTYGGDMNGDTIQGNDLIYIPRNATEIVLEPAGSSDTRTPDQIWQQLDAFINQDPYLSEHRGEYAERGAAHEPWVSRLDIGLKQEFHLNFGGQRNALEVSFDIINFGNLIDSDWGVIETAPTSSRQAIAFRRYDATNNVPVFTFPTTVTKTFSKNTELVSRWQAQFGIRYYFN